MPSNDDQELCYCRKCGGILRSKRTVRRHAGQVPAPVSLNLHQWLAEPKSIEEIADSESTTESDGSDDASGGEERGRPAKKRRVESDLDEPDDFKDVIARVRMATLSHGSIYPVSKSIFFINWLSTHKN